MKRNYLATIAITIVLFVPWCIESAHAALIEEGALFYDGADRKIIYDTDLDITWLDYTKAPATWNKQDAWATDLSFEINGIIYDNWRLPSAGQSPETGWYKTESELGHLWYIDLGFDLGEHPSSTTVNESVFDNFISAWDAEYWFKTELASNPTIAWHFSIYQGLLGVHPKNHGFKALAVIDGKVAASVSIPATIILLSSGIVGLVCLKKIRRRYIGLWY